MSGIRTSTKDLGKSFEKHKERIAITCTPSWSGILPGLLAILEDGDNEGKAIAKQELKRMAELADKYVQSQKQ